MNIQYLGLLAAHLDAQKDFYSRVLGLPAHLTSSGLSVKAGETEIRFLQAPSEFEGAYHFAFNIPENQYRSAREWMTSRIPLLHDKSGKEDFESKSWDSDSFYFLDATGNVLECIARHSLENAKDGDFNSQQILNVSEIGLPSEHVIELANELCTRLGVSVYKQEPNASFTPVGDENGLLILPVRGRIWMPDSGVPARLLPINVKGRANHKEWEIRGFPYDIST